MKALLSPLLVLVAFLAAHISATALTYNFAPNEKACFFAQVDEKGRKIAFYFAVQAGGSFDIDFSVMAPPNSRILFDGEKERQGDFVFTANEVGEYSFCFNNEISTVTDKMVDFDISVENELKASLPSRQTGPPEQASKVTESLYKVQSQINSITRMQKYFRTRENRHFSTVRSTESRIWRFSITENLVMVAMAGLQVFIVKFFFTGARKGHV